MTSTERPRLARRAPLNLQHLREQVEGWYAVKLQSALLQKTLNTGKESLKQIVHRYGVTDADAEKAHISLDLGEPIGDKRIMTLRNQKSQTYSTNEDAARRILGTRFHDVTETIEVIDQDKLWAAYWDNKITDDEMAQICPTSVHYSFVLVDADGKLVT